MLSLKRVISIWLPTISLTCPLRIYNRPARQLVDARSKSSVNFIPVHQSFSTKMASDRGLQPLSDEEAAKICAHPPHESTKDFMFQQTMYRIKDPRRSLIFYSQVLGMTLLKKMDFPEMKFSLYFMGYEDRANRPHDDKERTIWAMTRKATLELTHNWGTENQPDFAYKIGNADGMGYGHIGILVPDVDAACKRFEEHEIEFVKKPNEGKMKGLAFIKDPDGYWIEIFAAKTVAENN